MHRARLPPSSAQPLMQTKNIFLSSFGHPNQAHLVLSFSFGQEKNGFFSHFFRDRENGLLGPPRNINKHCGRKKVPSRKSYLLLFLGSLFCLIRTQTISGCVCYIPGISTYCKDKFAFFALGIKLLKLVSLKFLLSFIFETWFIYLI